MNSSGEDKQNQVRILIAEDSPTQAERLKYILERHGYLVFSTPNGRKALDAARSEKPTLVMSDILMPEMDGFELCRQIKTDQHLSDVSVILVTTLSDPQDVIQALESGADNFIVKPYDEDTLLARIQSVLQNRAIRSTEMDRAGVEIQVKGRRHLIKADRVQILNLLLSTYDAAIQRNQELIRAREALSDANAALEGANKELDAFSRSVSHDLRAPLRAVSNFNQIFIDDYGKTLDDTGRGLLERVNAEARRMGQLIDDLLMLSRISRGELVRDRVDLSALAKAVVADLQAREPNRTVTIRIADGLSTTGDARLLRIVMENLFSNAWKFTSKTSNPTIELGVQQQAGEQIFFVRDNGAGFDMRYVEKLFGTFQRLHSMEAFPGTGIGLATVRRIIHRHGGRVWAEGSVGAGATFYFKV